jgi:hypothetical protein
VTIPVWALAIIATMAIATLTALAQLSFFLGGVLKRLDASHEDIISLRKSRHAHAEVLSNHEARINTLEG